MRRLILFLLLALSVFPLLASHIISDGSLPDDVLSVVAEAVGRDTYGRSDILFHADGYSETILSDGSVSASFMFSFLEKQILTEGFGTDREELLRSFAYSVHGILFYEEALYSAAQMKLDYVLDGSYSLLIKQPLAYNSLKNAEKDIAKAIAAATGESYRIKLRLEGGTAQDDDDFSPEMRKLKAFFGGQLIHNDRIIAAKEADDDDFTIRNDEETQFS